IELSERSQKFFDQIAVCGGFRYLDVPFHVYGHLPVDLDLTVWALRRYCRRWLPKSAKRSPTIHTCLADGALTAQISSY
ncbi:hypothetical protein AB4084_28815, partial [Lysobacter sp. 2RAB21]